MNEENMFASFGTTSLSIAVYSIMCYSVIAEEINEKTGFSFPVNMWNFVSFPYIIKWPKPFYAVSAKVRLKSRTRIAIMRDSW